MSILKNKVVKLHYKLHEDDKNGEFIEETYGSEPLEFIFGVGMMLPSFEEHLEGKKSGDNFEFTLAPEDAYGEYEEGAVTEIAMNNFADENGVVDKEKLVEGHPIQMVDMEGRAYHGVIVELSDEFVTVDFNHPMAGRTLHFSGEIVDVRDASPMELEHGHIHHNGEHGDHHH